MISTILPDFGCVALKLETSPETDFFKTPLPPTQSLCHTPTTYAALSNPLFPTQSPSYYMNIYHNHTTTSMPSTLKQSLSPPQSPQPTPPQPKIQIETVNVQQQSSNNNNLDWKCNNIGYGPHMNNLSIRGHSFVNEYSEFVNKNCQVKRIITYTKVDQYASSKINRRSSTNNNNNNTTSSSNQNDHQVNNLPSSSTIICNNRRKVQLNKNSSNIKVINSNSNLLNGKKLPCNVTTSAIISNCNEGNNNNNNNNGIISLNSRNMQMLLKRCKTMPTTTTTTNNNNQQFLTLPGRGIVLKQHNQPDTYVIEDQIDDDEEEEAVEQQKVEAAEHLSRTAQILRKFRIPKTTALLPKMVAANNNKCLINTEVTVTPPPTVGTPNSTSSSVGFLEEVIEGVDEDEGTETVIIEAPLSKDEMLEESDEYMTDDNYLTEDGGMLSTNNSMSNLDNTVIMSNNNTTGTAAPLQLQTLQPNGAITCINLPPNTILLSAADGTILATTASTGSNKVLTSGGGSEQQQQQQLIALQDWSGNGGNVGMLPQNGTTTMLLTSDGNAIPILQQSMAAAAAANELLKTQVLA